MTDAAETLHNLDLNRYYRIYKNTYQMIIDRGYEPLEPQLAKKDWISRYLGYLAELEDETNDLDIFGIIDNMTLLFQRAKKKLLVYFHPLDSKLCQSDMNYIHNMMVEKKAQHLVVIANNKATPKVSSVLGILGHNAQLFSENDIMLVAPRHQLVPKHSLVTGAEREEILEAFTKTADGNCHLDLLPAMFTCDPIAKYYCYKVDDLIKIERPRMDGFIDISFRVVIYPVTEKDKKGT